MFFASVTSNMAIQFRYENEKQKPVKEKLRKNSGKILTTLNILQELYINIILQGHTNGKML